MCVWVCVLGTYETIEGSQVDSGRTAGKKKAEFSRMKRKQVTQELDKRMGSRGGRQME